ncbi:MAG: L-2-hydroxyglutarate oxidase [Acidobacteriota bacterium]
MGESQYDIVVVGAGLVGLATARALLHQSSSGQPSSLQASPATDLRLLVLDQEQRVASHQSGHNSGVVHSGLYYKPGSLKARLCAEGREALYRYCQRREIAVERCGKLVVAVDESEIPALEELHRRGVANGLDGIERLDEAGIRAREPAIRGVAGLWVPQTGIVDYRVVAEAYAADVEAGGGQLRTGARVLSVQRREGINRLQVRTGRGVEEVDCRLLVACAGLWSDRLARAAGLRPAVRIVPFRGEYYELKAHCQDLVKNLVYPVPDPRFPFLGVHFTRLVGGGVEAGPNAVLALARDGYTWGRVSWRDLASALLYPGFLRLALRYGRVGIMEVARSLSSRAFHRSLQRLMPELRREDLVRAGAGVRAQALRPDGRLVDDFALIEGEGQIHVLNAPSPAATASLAIGVEIARRAMRLAD